MFFRPYSGHRVSRVHSRLYTNGSVLTRDKVCKIKKECRHMANQTEVTGRSLAHLIGLLTSCVPAVYIAPLHYRNLQNLRTDALHHHLDYDYKVPKSPQALADLTWWVNNLNTACSQSAVVRSSTLPLFIVCADRELSTQVQDVKSGSSDIDSSSVAGPSKVPEGDKYADPPSNPPAIMAESLLDSLGPVTSHDNSVDI